MKGVLMRCRILLFTLCSFIVVAEAQAVSPPLVEEYLTSATANAYLTDANEFLVQHPQSKFAPRVLLDVLMVAERANDLARVKACQGQLLFEYTDSIQTHHVITSMKDAKACRELIKETVMKRVGSHPKALPQQFVKVISLAIGRFSNEILNDIDFLIMTYCLAEAAKDTSLGQMIRPLIYKKVAEKEAKGMVAAACLDAQRSLPVRIQLLNSMPDSAAKFPLRFYLSQLSEEEKTQAEILKIRAALALQDKKYDDVLTCFAQMTPSQQDQPQIQFWRAWALVGQQSLTEAKLALSHLVEKYPGHAWGTIAADYLTGLERLDDVRGSYVQEVLGIVETLKQDVSQFQAEILLDSKEGHRFVFHIGSDQEANRFECLVTRNGQAIVAYRTDDQYADFFFASEPEILRWPKPGPIPMPDITLDRSSDGGFFTSLNMSMEANLLGAGSKGLKMLESPYVSTETGLRMFLDYTMRRTGKVLLTPETKQGGDVTYGWMQPSVEEPKMTTMTITVTSDHRLKQLDFGRVQVNHLNYGPKGHVQVDLPAWPDKPVRTLAKPDPGMLFKMVGAFMELFQ